VPGKYNE
jgi:IQ domain-containing protein H